MKKTRIIIIVVIAAFAILGLIGLQIHWVKNTLEVRNAGFDETVEDAVGAVIKKIERRDISYRLINRFRHVDSMSELIHKLDSLNSTTVYDTLMQSDGFHQRHIRPDQEFNNNRSRNLEELQRLLDQSVLISNLFMDMMGLEHPGPVEERISETYIDSILDIELRKRGIKTDFIFGVMEPPYQDFVITNAEKENPGGLNNTEFSYDLFPNDIFREPVFLNIHFPRKHSYILSQMSLMLAIAVFLILLLIYSFYYTIHTIIRQKKLSEMKNDFINNMTHEFKTPISTISLACQTLNDDDVPKNQELYQDYINVINEENNRLGVMAEKILQTAIIDKGTMELKPEVTDMHEVIKNALDKIRMQVEQKNGRIITRFEASNPVVRADKFHMINVIYNLLDNANKYSLQEPHIEVITRNKTNGLQIDVSDNGIGISKANQKKIFEKLYRVPTGNIHDVKGFGLGLSYVKAILDKHGGDINLQSELKKGSTFSIFIPFQINESS